MDDEILVSEALADAVRAQGHDVIIANDGEEALALLSHAEPNAILLDVALKDLSGIDVLRRIRQTNQNLPVVLVTGERESGAARGSRSPQCHRHPRNAICPGTAERGPSDPRPLGSVQLKT